MQVLKLIRRTVYIYTYIHTYTHTYIGDKVADEVREGIDNALNIIVSTTERSANMKKELKQLYPKL